MGSYYLAAGDRLQGQAVPETPHCLSGEAWNETLWPTFAREKHEGDHPMHVLWMLCGCHVNSSCREDMKTQRKCFPVQAPPWTQRKGEPCGEEAHAEGKCVQMASAQIFQRLLPPPSSVSSFVKGVKGEQ